MKNKRESKTAKCNSNVMILARIFDHAQCHFAESLYESSILSQVRYAILMSISRPLHLLKNWMNNQQMLPDCSIVNLILANALLYYQSV